MLRLRAKAHQLGRQAKRKSPSLHPIGKPSARPCPIKAALGWQAKAQVSWTIGLRVAQERSNPTLSTGADRPRPSRTITNRIDLDVGGSPIGSRGEDLRNPRHSSREVRFTRFVITSPHAAGVHDANAERIRFEWSSDPGRDR